MPALTSAGGSPIITWLPNQLGVVLKAMTESGSRINLEDLNDEDRALAKELVKRASVQQRVLNREVQELAKRFKGQNL